jgi:hypothetical protein
LWVNGKLYSGQTRQWQRTINHKAKEQNTKLDILDKTISKITQLFAYLIKV